MAITTSEMSATQIVAYFKVKYPQRVVDNLVEYDTAFWKDLKKTDDLEGITTRIPIQLDAPQGLSADIQAAMGNMTPSVGRAWQIEPAENYGGVRIDAKSMLASRNNKGAFFKLREREYESLMQQMGQRFEAQCWQTGSGKIGRVSGTPGTGTTFQLENIEDSINFHEGMTIRFYDGLVSDPTEPDTADESPEGTRVVSAVNHDTGVITVSVALLGTVVDLDVVVRDGDLDSLATGVPKWIPAADPTDTLFGVARTNYPQMLGGHRGTWQGTIEETVKTLDAKIRRFNQKPKTLWLSYANFNRLDLELGARGMRMEDGKKGVFGRTRLMMSTPGGGCEVKCSPYCPEDTMFLLDMSSWEVHSLGALPHLVKDDGLSAVRVGFGASAEDAIEIRVRAFWQLVCVNPFANGRAPIS